MDNQTSPNENGNPDSRFIEKVGQHFESEGMSRIGGRILGYLLLQKDPRSLDEIADALHVSKASISSNTRFLEGYGLLERVTLPGDRRDYYELGGDMHKRLLERRVKWLRGTVQLLSDGCCTEHGRDPLVQARLAGMKQFFAHMIEAIAAIQERWNRSPGEV